MTWHISADLAVGYAAGTVDEADAASVEAHVAGCATCQRRLTELAPMQPRLDRVWSAITETLDAPRASVVERVFRRLGMRESDARLIAVTPGVTTAWLVSIAGAIAFAALRSSVGGRAGALFLLLAPLVPLLAVTAAFSGRLDPAAEVTTAAPVGGVHLALVRGVAALVPATVVATLASTWVPGLGERAGAWLLPAAALCLCSLAASTWTPPTTAAAVLSAAWFAGIVGQLVRSHEGFTAAAMSDLLATPGTQAGFGALAVAAALVVVARRETFEFGR